MVFVGVFWLPFFDLLTNQIRRYLKNSAQSNDTGYRKTITTKDSQMEEELPKQDSVLSLASFPSFDSSIWRCTFKDSPTKEENTTQFAQIAPPTGHSVWPSLGFSLNEYGSLSISYLSFLILPSHLCAYISYSRFLPSP